MRKKWEPRARVMRYSRISQKEFEQRLDEVVGVLLDRSASSKKTFSTSSLFSSHHGLFGDIALNETSALNNRERTGTDG